MIALVAGEQIVVPVPKEMLEDAAAHPAMKEWLADEMVQAALSALEDADA